MSEVQTRRHRRTVPSAACRDLLRLVSSRTHRISWISSFSSLPQELEKGKRPIINKRIPSPSTSFRFLAFVPFRRFWFPSPQPKSSSSSWKVALLHHESVNYFNLFENGFFEERWKIFFFLLVFFFPFLLIPGKSLRSFRIKIELDLFRFLLLLFPGGAEATRVFRTFRFFILFGNSVFSAWEETASSSVAEKRGGIELEVFFFKDDVILLNKNITWLNDWRVNFTSFLSGFFTPSTAKRVSWARLFMYCSIFVFPDCWYSCCFW